jgi:hypothetical protein
LEEFLHAFFCPEHGVLINGIEAIDDLIDHLPDAEEDDEPQIRIIDGTVRGIPPEVVYTLSRIFGTKA